MGFWTWENKWWYHIPIGSFIGIKSAEHEGNNYFKGDTTMRWGVESELPMGAVVLCIFEAKDEEAAQDYISYMREVGHTNVFNLKTLPDNVTVEDLKRLFPHRVETRS